MLVDMSYVSYEQCINMTGCPRSNKNCRIDAVSMLCARNAGTSPCQADGGGALTMQRVYVRVEEESFVCTFGVAFSLPVFKFALLTANQHSISKIPLIKRVRKLL
jgi:hypothetical protein